MLSSDCVDRFWAKVEKTDDCWLWQASLGSHGYGQFNIGSGCVTTAHRVAYELLVGPIPEGLQIDHLCRNRLCVNPAHLEVVTQQENTQRGDAGLARGAQMRARTHCPQGHPYDEANTYVNPKGHRGCRACQRRADRRHRERKRVA